ncbi:nucleoside-diphosphate sugar epimerase/dehydratase [Paenibacillus sp. LHD-117]|uniref:polysaccharide biosynthesis protein n=1 Tax=Paenibacillus sp. LHD-117 TaxID=3071412 RepID=UPI0027DFA306|nr:nucleoside-diphosphate sugar epimerase/dehydratase [Paenibacillus sp. LHD-117]MDQ6420686.1 nucleoside-diphosphate sugar epimerase/dehydratase [Paenibacillus sp. LHD-117]
MSMRRKNAIILVVDILIIWTAVVSAYLFRFNGDIPSGYAAQMVMFALVSTMTCSISFAYFRMYKRMWQYASIGEIISLIQAVLAGMIISYGLTYLIDGDRVPLSITTRTVETMLLFMGGSRFLWRLIRVNRSVKNEMKTNILVAGAGDCGALIAKEIMTNRSFSQSKLVGFIDDDPHKRRMQVMGYPVLGNRNDIAAIVKHHQIHDIVIAMPSSRRADISDLINICILSGAKVKIIPAIDDIITGRLAIQTLRNVEVEDLLGREPVKIDMNGIMDYVTDKVVLVTGAGGSIGSELSRQIATFQPKRLLLLGHGENSIYTIEMELRSKFPQVSLETIIADIQDRSRIDEVFRQLRPQVVFHAAAHKHVPLMERNPSEAVKNNVFGTKNVADAADKHQAERFVMISSDKAVNPTSIMGATKRIAEMYIQSINVASRTQFVAVRFGNVLGSRGSVIPRFKEQIAAGGPVTVTHPEMVRYFMTIPEAVQLVIQAGAFAQGGEIFILDMGKPVRILDLAKDLIRMSGLEPDVDIPIRFSGLREGEKLYEELLTEAEATTATQHERIFIGKPQLIDRSELDLKLRQFEKVFGAEPAAVKAAIEQLVPFYVQVHVEFRPEHVEQHERRAI